MIQRIQSVYLSMTMLLSIIFLKGSFLKFINNSGSDILMNFTGTWQSNIEGGLDLLWKHIPVTVVIVLIPLLTISSLLTFKNRKLQIKLTAALIFFTVIFITLAGYYGLLVINRYQAEILPDYKIIIPLFMIVFEILAIRGIKKDENLVRSYDRLR